jgi:hypothetical protein
VVSCSPAQLSLELKKLEEGSDGAPVMGEQVRCEMLRTMLAFGRDNDHVGAAGGQIQQVAGVSCNAPYSDCFMQCVCVKHILWNLPWLKGREMCMPDEEDRGVQRCSGFAVEEHGGKPTSHHRTLPQALALRVCERLHINVDQLMAPGPLAGIKPGWVRCGGVWYTCSTLLLHIRSCACRHHAGLPSQAR